MLTDQELQSLRNLGNEAEAADEIERLRAEMTLRDYFAAKTAPALLQLCQHDAHEGQDYLSYCAGLSYKMADAMLKARGL